MTKFNLLCYLWLVCEVDNSWFCWWWCWVGGWWLTVASPPSSMSVSCGVTGNVIVWLKEDAVSFFMTPGRGLFSGCCKHINHRFDIKRQLKTYCSYFFKSHSLNTHRAIADVFQICGPDCSLYVGVLQETVGQHDVESEETTPEDGAERQQ